MKEPKHIKEAKIFLNDCGILWFDMFDLIRIKKEQPDIADICEDIISYLITL